MKNIRCAGVGSSADVYVTAAIFAFAVAQLGGCAFEPLYPGDAAPQADAAPTADTGPAVDAGVPADTGNTPVDTGVTPPTDNGTPFECTPGEEIDPEDCIPGIMGTTHRVCSAGGNKVVCRFRPGCNQTGCPVPDAGMPRVCTPGAVTDMTDCVPGVVPGSTWSVCNASGTGSLCRFRPGCNQTGCPTPDAGMPMPPPPDAGMPMVPPHVTTDVDCDGRALTGVPSGCENPALGAVCYHVCVITPTYMQNSRHPNSEQRTAALRLVQTEDPSQDVDLATVSAPAIPTSGVRAWEAGAYASIRPSPAGFPFFNAENQYATAVTGPFPYLWSVGQNFRGMGLETNGVLRIYRVNADGTQTLVSWRIVANEPAMVGTPMAYYNGGNAHVIGSGCPFYLTERMSGDYRCTP